MILKTPQIAAHDGVVDENVDIVEASGLEKGLSTATSRAKRNWRSKPSILPRAAQAGKLKSTTAENHLQNSFTAGPAAKDAKGIVNAPMLRAILR
jgi:hypothetical protein